MSPELTRKLKTVLAGRSAVDMGQFQFLNLDRVREETGEDWPNLREKVYDVSAHFIEKRIDAGDVAIRCRGGFMIVFAAVDAEAAAAKVSGIAAELERFFLGDGRFDALELSSEARSVTTEELLEIVARAQDEGGGRQPAAPGDAAGNAAEPRPRWQSVDRPDRPTVQPTARHDPGEDGDVWDEIVFRPCWDARRGALTYSVCLPRRVVNGFAYFGRDVLMGRDEPDLHRRMDIAVARAAQRGFQKARARTGPCVIVIPVHYATLSTPSRRMDYLALLQAVPEPVRRFFHLRIDGVPSGAPIGGTQELFRSMKPFGGQMLVKLPFGAIDLHRFEGCNVGVFDADIPAGVNEAGPSDAQLAALTDWVVGAHAMKADTALAEADNADFAQVALAAGVRYLSGPGVAGDTLEPLPPRPLALSEILGGRGADSAASG